MSGEWLEKEGPTVVAYGQGASLRIISRRGLDGSGVAREGGGPGGYLSGRRLGWDHRPGRRLRGGRFPGVLCRAGGWRCGSPCRRIGGCRKIRRGRGGGD